jgi:hypothetical protein
MSVYFVHKSILLLCNYLVSGLYEGFQFKIVTKRLVVSPKSSVLQCNYLVGGLHAGVQFYNATTWLVVFIKESSFIMQLKGW